MKPIGKFFRETRGRTGNRRLRRIAKQKATDHRWLFVTSQTGLGLRGGSGSKQVGVVDFHIIGKGQLAGSADHSMVGLSRRVSWLERAIFRLDGLCRSAE